jgi:hypothetical protein
MNTRVGHQLFLEQNGRFHRVGGGYAPVAQLEQDLNVLLAAA